MPKYDAPEAQAKFTGHFIRIVRLGHAPHR
jgi:hypothetical protein